jgi:CO/xanthine dehydrogenase Mo-binding subunit
VVLRSYVIGAAHMAFGLVTSEALSVDADGDVHDLTIRSFGVVRAADVPAVDVRVEPGDGPPLPVSDAAFVAVATAVWLAQGCPPDLPSGNLQLR